jgi:hypothetical protein
VQDKIRLKKTAVHSYHAIGLHGRARTNFKRDALHNNQYCSQNTASELFQNLIECKQGFTSFYCFKEIVVLRLPKEYVNELCTKDTKSNNYATGK